MAKVRNLLRHTRIETARGVRRCRRNREHAIGPGEPCLVVKDEGSPYGKSYCRHCSVEILEQCQNVALEFVTSLNEQGEEIVPGEPVPVDSASVSRRTINDMQVTVYQAASTFR